MPPLQAAANTAHFPTKPLVRGIPAKLSMKIEKIVAASGARRPSPTQLLSRVASQLASRTIVTNANAPIVAAPYATR